MSSVSKRPEIVEEYPAVSQGTGLLHRAFDISCAAVGLLILSPLFGVIAVAIKFDDGGPVFYLQDRVGKHFQPFRVCKFRSMVTGADRHGLLTARGDPRLTRIGRLLRRYKLDELPQLFNVLAGDMQLVGARPELERYVQMFRAQYAVILQDRPGITDPATLVYRREDQILSVGGIEQQYVSEILPAKLKLSRDYQQQRTFRSDLGTLFRTVLGLVH
jgi:lipopolysaccharide/colanic/teichoic acid biosynthesis glycosyltransferase